MWVEEIQITFKDDSVPIEVTGNACFIHSCKSFFNWRLDFVVPVNSLGFLIRL